MEPSPTIRVAWAGFPQGRPVVGAAGQVRATREGADMALQHILFSADPDDETRAEAHASIVSALRRAFPLPAEDAEGRFREMLEELSRRVPAGRDRHT